MCGSMADIQSATTDIRRGKKEERKKKPQDENIMVCPIPYGDHNNEIWQQAKSLRKRNLILEMWANAQRDGRPAKHRWRPLFNAAKFG